MPLVGVILGSKSDQSLLQGTLETLNRLNIDYEDKVISAHRNPEKAKLYAEGARDRGIEVIIAAAGGAAALPGVMASWTTLPVIGIPLPTSDLNGIDALYSIVQMPPGIPVATVAVGKWGAINAALLAAAILGLSHDKIALEYERYRQSLKEA